MKDVVHLHVVLDVLDIGMFHSLVRGDKLYKHLLWRCTNYHTFEKSYLRIPKLVNMGQASKYVSGHMSACP